MTKHDKPNLWKLAQEISSYKDPHRVANALMSMLAADAAPAEEEEFGINGGPQSERWH